MNEEITVSEAYARRDDPQAMNRLFEPLPYLGLREELARHVEGVTMWHHEPSNTMHVLVATPDIVACYVVAGVSLEEGATIMAHAETDDDPKWSTARLIRAVEAVMPGGDTHRVN